MKFSCFTGNMFGGSAEDQRDMRTQRPAPWRWWHCWRLHAIISDVLVLQIWSRHRVLSHFSLLRQHWSWRILIEFCEIKRKNWRKDWKSIFKDGQSYLFLIKENECTHWTISVYFYNNSVSQCNQLWACLCCQKPNESIKVKNVQVWHTPLSLDTELCSHSLPTLTP